MNCTHGQTVFRGSRLTVTFQFIGVVEGYEYECKTKVFVDGEEVGESEIVNEGARTTFSVIAPRGMHHVRIVNYAN